MLVLRDVLSLLAELRPVCRLHRHCPLSLQCVRLVLVFGDLILTALVQVDEEFGQCSDFLLSEQKSSAGMAADAAHQRFLAVQVKDLLVVEVLNRPEQVLDVAQRNVLLALGIAAGLAPNIGQG